MLLSSVIQNHVPLMGHACRIGLGKSPKGAVSLESLRWTSMVVFLTPTGESDHVYESMNAPRYTLSVNVLLCYCFSFVTVHPPRIVSSYCTKCPSTIKADKPRSMVGQ